MSIFDCFHVWLKEVVCPSESFEHLHNLFWIHCDVAASDQFSMSSTVISNLSFISNVVFWTLKLANKKCMKIDFTFTQSYARYWPSKIKVFWSLLMSCCDQGSSVRKHFLITTDWADKWGDRIFQILSFSQKLSKLWLVTHKS